MPFILNMAWPGLHLAQLHNAFMEQFPSATLVDVLDDLGEMRKRVNDLSFAISILGGLVFACGGLIMIGSIAMPKLNRLYEAPSSGRWAPERKCSSRWR